MNSRAQLKISKVQWKFLLGEKGTKTIKNLINLSILFSIVNSSKVFELNVKAIIQAKKLLSVKCAMHLKVVL